MPTSNSDAVAQRPTLEQEMEKFKGFATVDGEVASGAAVSHEDERAAIEAQEKQAEAINSRSHEDNQKAGTTSTEGSKQAPATAKVELTEQEEDAAIQAATDKKGAQLTDEEADEAVGKALTAKQATEAKAARKKDANARIGELTRLRRTAERETEGLRRDNEDLRRRLEALERGEKPAALTTDTPAAKTNTVGVKPDPTDAEKYPYGELDAKYLAALARYETLNAIAEREEGQKTQTQQRQDAEAAAAFHEAKTAFEEAGIEQFDDFEDVVIATYSLKEGDPGWWPASQTIVELAFTSEQGPAIAHYLASNPKEAQRIHKLSSARQAAWFGTKEAELSAGSAASTDKQDDGSNPPQVEARRQRQLPQPSNSQVRESKAPQPLPSQRRVNGAGGNRMPSSATTDFRAFESMAMGGKR